MDKPKSDLEWLMLAVANIVEQMDTREAVNIHKPTMFDRLNHGLLTDLPECEERAEFAAMHTQAESLIKPR